MVCAHRLRDWQRAISRRGRPFADLGILCRIPLEPMLAHILAQVVDTTDLRSSRSGGATVPAAAHRLRQCRRAMTHRGGLFADFRTRTSTCTRCMHSRMQLSSLHLNGGADSPGLLSMNLIGGQFRMNVEHSAAPRACTDTITLFHARNLNPRHSGDEETLRGVAVRKTVAHVKAGSI